MTRRSVLPSLALLFLSWIGCTEDLTDRPRVYCEEVAPDSALEAAGLRVGDELVAWRLLAPGRTNHGTFESPFLWYWLETEIAHRGHVLLDVVRDGYSLQITVQPRKWDVQFTTNRRALSRVRPELSPRQHALYREGKALFAAGELERGIAAWEQIAGESEDAVRATVRCWVLQRIAEEQAHHGAWDQTEQTVRRALELAGDPYTLLSLLEVLGKSFEYRGRLRDAESVFRQTLEIRTENWGADSLSAARSWHRMGAMALNRGAVDRGRQFLEESLRLRSAAAPGSLAEADSLHGLAFAHNVSFNLEEAEKHLIRAMQIIDQRAPESDYLAYILGSLGDIALGRGDAEMARFYFDEMRHLLVEHYPGSNLHAGSLKGLARVALFTGELEKARKLFDQGVDLDDVGALDSAILARILIQGGKIDEAEEVLTGTLKDFDSIAPRTKSGLLYMLGYVNESQRDVDESIKWYRRTLENAKLGIDDYATEARALRGISFMHFLKGDVEQAVASTREAIGVLDKRILRVSSGKSSEMLHRALARGTYKHAVDIFIAAGMEEEAFHQIESYKGKIILELLHRRDLDFSVDLSGDLDQRRRQLNHRRDDTVAGIDKASQTNDQENLARLQRDLRAIDLERTEIDREIVEKSPKFAELSQPQPIDLQNLRDTLDEGTAFISYLVTDNNINMFVVTRRDGLRHKAWPVSERRVRAAVTALRENLARHKTPHGAFHGIFIQSAAEVYSLVFEPIHDLVRDARRLVVSPDGPLHFVPFGALVVDQDSDTGKVRFLIEEKPLTVVSSGSLYARSVKARPGAASGLGPSILAFGDPDYPTPESTERLLSREDARFRAATERGMLRFGDLPFSRREVLDVTAQFDDSRAFLGPEALEEVIKRMDLTFDYVHFAVHGYLDPYSPLSSALVFTIPEQRTEGRDNGLLQVWEVFESLRMNADLVVLSACETALGEEMGGEGLIGLTRAFQYAGAHSVVASLWSVQDRSTAALMARFYEYLLAGNAKDVALQAAQVDLLHGLIKITDEAGNPVPADTSAPYYWAPFQLYGDWQSGAKP